jgi:hypothetical protein
VAESRPRSRLRTGASMSKPIFAYRIWRRGPKWYWEVILEGSSVLSSGIANSSVTARASAMLYCLEHQEHHSEP